MQVNNFTGLSRKEKNRPPVEPKAQTISLCLEAPLSRCFLASQEAIEVLIRTVCAKYYVASFCVRTIRRTARRAAAKARQRFSIALQNRGIAKSVFTLSCVRRERLWKCDYDDQTWIVVGEQNFSSVQIRNGCDEAEAKTVSFCRTTFLQTIETPENFFALCSWDSRPGVFDRHFRSSVFLAQLDANSRSRRAMNDRVFNQIDKELIEKFPIAVDEHAR